MSSENSKYYAHSGPSLDRWEPVPVHLRFSGKRAEDFASEFGAGDEGCAAGLLHDLGKYSPLFFRRLQGKERGLDHWSLGAYAALKEYGEQGVALALVIQGHHTGLGKGDGHSLAHSLDLARLSKDHPLGLRLTTEDYEEALRCLREDGIELPKIERSILDRSQTQLIQMLDVRMLFSALVDADFLETEAHFEGAEDGTRRYREKSPELEPGSALKILLSHISRLAEGWGGPSHISSLRADLLDSCLANSDSDPGLFTLTAPTGAGKTLAMLAFALSHAKRHGLRRIVLAIPFLTIIEQTAKIYREIFEPHFGSGYVLEHHGLSGAISGTDSDEKDHEGEGRRRTRQLIDNWDAPVILTTNVQLLESLFANRTGRCRKLHRLSKSVLLFDEVQTLPAELAVPTLSTLSRVAQRYDSSVLFATATQPAFDHLDPGVRNFSGLGWTPRELAPAALRLFDRARRTRVVWRAEEKIGWEVLAKEFLEHPQLLCIVNLKRHARELTRQLKSLKSPGLLHMSTNLCPSHRDNILKEVRRRLKHGEPCVLVSTQCVEAGVDVDFPRVYRALGPLEAIAQAAGRCNRNGRLEVGEVHVFVPEDEGYPPGGYKRATEVTRSLLNQKGHEADINRPELSQEYYRTLYDVSKVAEDGCKELMRAIDAMDFPEVAKRYQLIGGETIRVLVPYHRDMFDRLKDALEEKGYLTQTWIRQANAHSVNLYRPRRDDGVWAYLNPAPLFGGESSEDWFIYLNEDHYDRDLLGLMEAEKIWIG